MVSNTGSAKRRFKIFQICKLRALLEAAVLTAASHDGDSNSLYSVISISITVIYVMVIIATYKAIFPPIIDISSFTQIWFIYLLRLKYAVILYNDHVWLGHTQHNVALKHIFANTSCRTQMEIRNSTSINDTKNRGNSEKH